MAKRNKGDILPHKTKERILKFFKEKVGSSSGVTVLADYQYWYYDHIPGLTKGYRVSVIWDSDKCEIGNSKKSLKEALTRVLKTLEECV